MSNRIGRGLAVLTAWLGALSLMAAAPQAFAQQALSMGGSSTGALQGGDRTLDSGEYYDAYTFEGRAGQTVVIDARSGDFDAYVMLRGPGGFTQDNDDGPGGGTDAQLTVTLPASGTYVIQVTSYQPGETGRYSIGLRQSGGQAGGTAGGQARGQGASALRVGGSVTGRLQAGDSTLTSGEYVDILTFEGRAGQQITLDMHSGQFDAYLMLRGPGGFAEENDDRPGGGSTDAQISVRLPATGTYRVQATSYQPGESGEYRIALREGQAAFAGAEGGGAVRLNETLTGRLAAGDVRIDSGEYVDGWTLRGVPGRRYVARLASNAFDSYLMVRGTGLNQDNDDEPGGRGSRNALIEFVMPADGEASIIATSYQPGETGAYALTVTEAGASGGAGGATGVGDRRNGRLQIGQSLEGRLAQGDQTLRSGEYTQVYTLQGRAGDRIELRLSSRQFDPYIFITGPGDFADANDDDPTGQDGANSRLTVTLPADGEYQVVATSYAPGETGGFRLSASRVSGETPRPVSTDRTAAFANGGEIRGSLGAGDRTLSSGEYVDNHTFTGRRGERVSVAVESSQFDTYLIVSGPNGFREDNDDGPDGANSRLDFTLPADGEYTVGVTSYAAGETGAYRLTVGPSLGSPRQAGVSGGPRVFAVMVGVSDYGGNGDLAYTADDALKLAEALRREGVLNPASIVLTDAQATVGGVRRAFAQVAAQAGPDDIFLFFFSGHGSQQRTAVSNLELDGLAETLVMRDGQITDAELAEMFGTLNTRLSLIVLDSCFSGGFARNVVSRPGVIGLFSSEEDLTSQVAGKFQAGGYLSHFLRLAFSGEANLDGDDILTAGELTTYLRRKFAAEVQDVSAQTMDGQRSYQNLVVDRGGVQVDDVVIRLAR